MEAHDVIVVALAIVAYGLISRRLASSAVTAPMFFVAAGTLASPHGLGWLHLQVDERAIHVLAELTLVLVLFGDAARIDLRALRRELGLPVRLLGIGMPLTIVAGTFIAKWIFPSFDWMEAAVVSTVLAPTDAALGQAVVSNRVVPQRIRQSLNVESGLNDGIALPVVMVLAALGSMEATSQSGTDWARYATMQVTLGPLVGVAVGWLGGAAAAFADKRRWMGETPQRLVGLAMALLAYGLAEVVGGNGFISAFIAGLTLGNAQRNQCEWMYQFLEAEGQLLMLLVFLFLGSSLAIPALAHADWRIVLYALLSLTAVRMVPVAVSLFTSGLRLPSVLFVGWFGPRGLATILFAILIVNRSDLAHKHDIFNIAIFASLLSVFLHGLSATPLASAYGRVVSSEPACPREHEPMTEHPLRGGTS